MFPVILFVPIDIQSRRVVTNKLRGMTTETRFSGWHLCLIDATLKMSMKVRTLGVGEGSALKSTLLNETLHILNTNVFPDTLFYYINYSDCLFMSVEIYC